MAKKDNEIVNEGTDVVVDTPTLDAKPLPLGADVVVNDVNPLPPAVDTAPTTLTPNQEDDQEAIDSGYLFGLELGYFEKFTEAQLLKKRYSADDIVRIKRVLALMGKELPLQPIEKVVAEKPPQPEG